MLFEESIESSKSVESEKPNDKNIQVSHENSYQVVILRQDFFKMKTEIEIMQNTIKNLNYEVSGVLKDMETKVSTKALSSFKTFVYDMKEDFDETINGIK